MEELGQQSLIEQPKPRSLIVPKGCTSWWGVDSSTRCVAIGVATAGQIVVENEPFPKTPAMQRLSIIYETSRVLAARLATAYPPGLVFVEQPSGSGQQVNHELEFAVGCSIAGIYDGVRAAGMVPAMELIVASFWKKAACGNGAIKKTMKVEGKRWPQPLPLEEYPVMQWARLNGYDGDSWDSADAMAMAHAARVTCDLVAR